MPANTYACRVDATRTLAPDVLAVYLRCDCPLPIRFVAGQYVDVMLPNCRPRSFSIANAPEEGPWIELHVRRSTSDFLEQIVGAHREQASLALEGPHGALHFRVDSPRPAIMVAGGTGYAPIRAMLRHVLRADPAREIHLYWGGRIRADLYEHEMLTQWAERYSEFRYTPALSAPLPEDQWSGRTGLIHETVLDDYADLRDVDVYCSGPPPMIEAIGETFTVRGLPAAQLYFDRSYAPAR